MEVTKKTTKKQAELLATCDKCGKCCKYSSGFMLKEDITRLSKHLNISEEKLKKLYLKEKTILNKELFRPKLKKQPFGECIFLKAGKCSVHKAKPLQCRTSSCNKYGEKLNAWFMLNHILDKNDPESIRQYKYYLDENPAIKGGSLKELVPDEKKLKKILNFDILR